jgi:hypothetical protein
MVDTTRNRLIGAIILLTGLVGLGFVYQLSGLSGQILSFFSGAALGSGSAILISGKPLWNSDTWWASKHPLKRDWL